MGVKVKERKGAWWVFINHRGQRRAKRCASKKAATMVADKIDAALRLGHTDVLEPQSRPGQVPTLAEYSEMWLPTLSTRVRGSTADDYATRLRVRILPLLGSLPLTEITRERVRRFLGELAARGNRRVTKHRPLARATLKGTLHVLSALLGRAAEDGLIPVNPARGLARDIAAPTSSEVQEVEVFTPGELGGLLGVAESDYPEWHPFLLCLARTGIRLGEAVALEWRDVDFERRVLVIRRTERRGRVNVPKSGKARRVDMSPQLTATLSGLTSLQEAEAALVGRTAPARVPQQRVDLCAAPGRAPLPEAAHAAPHLRQPAHRSRGVSQVRPGAARAPLPGVHPGRLWAPDPSWRPAGGGPPGRCDRTQPPRNLRVGA